VHIISHSRRNREHDDIEKNTRSFNIFSLSLLFFLSTLFFYLILKALCSCRFLSSSSIFILIVVCSEQIFAARKIRAQDITSLLDLGAHSAEERRRKIGGIDKMGSRTGR
jgi:hypothetical protein